MLPNFFSKEPIPDKVPKELEVFITELKKCSSKEDCLKAAYEYVTSRWHGERVKTYLFSYRLFSCNINKIIKTRGFLHCNHLNYLLRILLVRSGHFKDEDIEQEWSLVWHISPHQYLEIDLGSKKIFVDAWGKYYGVQLGCYTTGFGKECSES